MGETRGSFRCLFEGDREGCDPPAVAVKPVPLTEKRGPPAASLSAARQRSPKPVPPTPRTGPWHRSVTEQAGGLVLAHSLVFNQDQ